MLLLGSKKPIICKVYNTLSVKSIQFEYFIILYREYTHQLLYVLSE